MGTLGIQMETDRDVRDTDGDVRDTDRDVRDTDGDRSGL